LTHVEHKQLIRELRAARASLLESSKLLFQPTPVAHVLAVEASAGAMARAIAQLEAIDQQRPI